MAPQAVNFVGTNRTPLRFMTAHESFSIARTISLLRPAGMRSRLPTLANGLREFAQTASSDKQGAPLAAMYARLESISIDYGVLEKSPRIVVVPVVIGWSDLGDWSSIHCWSSHDERGNAVYGQSFVQDSENSLIYSSHRPVAALGLKNLIVVESEECSSCDHE